MNIHFMLLWTYKDDRKRKEFNIMIGICIQLMLIFNLFTKINHEKVYIVKGDKKWEVTLIHC